MAAGALAVLDDALLIGFVARERFCKIECCDPAGLCAVRDGDIACYARIRAGDRGIEFVELFTRNSAGAG